MIGGGKIGLCGKRGVVGGWDGGGVHDGRGIGWSDFCHWEGMWMRVSRFGGNDCQQGLGSVGVFVWDEECGVGGVRYLEPMLDGDVGDEGIGH